MKGCGPLLPSVLIQLQASTVEMILSHQLTKTVNHKTESKSRKLSIAILNAFKQTFNLFIY